MWTVTLNLLLLAILSYARNIRYPRDALASPVPPDFILPVQHVREVQDGYLTFKDHQLGSESAEEDTRKKCVPRDSPEGIARLLVINQQLAEAAAGQELPAPEEKPELTEEPNPTAEPETPAPTGPIDDGENISEEPSRPPFNDTTPFDGVDVGETMELRIYKPLCDY